MLSTVVALAPTPRTGTLRRADCPRVFSSAAAVNPATNQPLVLAPGLEASAGNHWSVEGLSRSLGCEGELRLESVSCIDNIAVGVCVVCPEDLTRPTRLPRHATSVSISQSKPVRPLFGVRGK